MKYLIIKVGIFLVNTLYMFIKILPVKKRVVFISRQSNKESEDIHLLKKELKKIYKDLQVVVLCKKLENGLANKIMYLFHMFKQMYYLATSKVIILDSYCICASILKKKKNTIIIQMWHALGAFKKFGYSILDKEEGSNSKLANVMKMHANYDYVCTSSEEVKKYFSEAFNYDLDKLITMPLPRVDKLIDKKYKEKIKKNIFEKYPQLKKKKNIVYAPTFRKGEEKLEPITNLINKIDFSKYNLIIKLHPLSEINIRDKRVLVDKDFSSIDMMIISSYVITDYSAIVFEAAILNKPLFFYCYDIDKYYKKRDFYIDYKKEMPGILSSDPKEVIFAIETENYDLEKIEKFQKKYVDYKKSCTSNFVKFIIKNIKSNKR